jgi:hypothetical protein
MQPQARLGFSILHAPMRIEHGAGRLSASDLANHLGCRHLTILDLAAAKGELRSGGHQAGP